ncbi:MAG TPA: ATP-binding protein [Xanthobacteraceae bacterium]
MAKTARTVSARSTRSRRARRRAPPARALELMVAALAHDIRTPLTGILALAELLAAGELGERERGWVASLKSSAEHLEALTTLVVDAVRKEARDLVLRREPFDPRALAHTVGASLKARAQAAGLAARIELAPGLPARVIGDAVRLRAALENLIDNAVKFTEAGEVALQVSSERTRERRVRLVFAVRDSGIGLTAAEMRRLFRPFRQASAAVARRFGGAGLGLALVKRLAKAMGGDLTVTSRRGRGSTFRLSVTVDETTRGAPSARGTRALRVLHVEDNPYGRVVMNTILTGLGHHVEFAGSGAAAIAAIKRGGYDAVLMDVTLADMDGLEATRRIRALGGAIPIIGISGHAEAADAARAAGMNDYLVKPVSPRALAEALAAPLDG